MPNKFTQKAQNVLNHSLSLARELGHTYIGSEHLLLALISEKDSIASRLLLARGANAAKLRKSIIDLSGVGSVSDVTPEDMTPSVKKIVEVSASESLGGGHHYIGTEHLLCALLGERDCIAVRLLESEGIPASELKTDLAVFLVSSPQKGRKPDPTTPSEEKLRIKGAPTLSSYGRDLTEAAAQGRIDPVIGRDVETERVIRILSRRTKNNPCLIGEPGVGKTAVVEGLAQRIVNGSVPPSLRDKRIVTLDVPSMIAGAKYRGEFEDRMKHVMEEIEKNPDIILFIDEIHVIIGAGAAEGAVDAANILKPALARSALQMIGATTLAEYRGHIERDAALERRFQSVMVEEPSPEAAMEILVGLRDQYEEFHGVKIDDSALDAAIRLSSRYIPDRYLPDKAIDLLDEAAAELRIASLDTSNALQSNEELLRVLANQKEEAILSQNFERAAELRDREREERHKGELLRQSDAASATLPTVTQEQVAAAVTGWTGIPVNSLLEDESRRLMSLEERLLETVIGQEEAVRCVCRAIRRGRMGLRDPRRPIGSFIFLGQSGVGKTELSKAIATEMFGGENALIRLDMSEYMEKHSVSRMIGSPPGYVGYEEGGQLTERVRRRPYSVILLDEIEKAHPDVFNLLLQVLEDGILSDSAGRKIVFSNTIIIMTSNLGSIQNGKGVPFGFSEETSESKSNKRVSDALSALRDQFRPELLNRVDEIVFFNTFSEKDLMQISENLLSQTVRRAQELGLVLKPNPDVVSRIAREYCEREGARSLRRAVVRLVEEPLSLELLSKKIGNGDRVLLLLEDDRIVFKLEAAQKKNATP